MTFKKPLQKRTTREPHGVASSLPESVFAAMLTSIAAYMGVSSFYLDGNDVAFVQQSVVLLLFSFAVLVHRIYQHKSWAKFYRCLLIFGFISFLYNALAGLAFNNVPWISDGLLYAYDGLLGLELVHTQIAPAITQVRWKTELLAFAYAAFIPYLCVSVYLYGTHRNTQLREIFLLSVALLYAVGFLGYLFVPAHGPIVHLAEQVTTPINSGYFHTLVTNSVNQAGGPHGAFPSIHVGGAVLMCLFDFRHGCRTRAWLFLPLVLLIALATVMLRYHYVVDLLAGLAIAVLALFVAELWVGKQIKIKFKTNSIDSEQHTEHSVSVRSQ